MNYFNLDKQKLIIGFCLSIIFTICLPFVTVASAQNVTVSGKVVDVNNAPIMGVNIAVMGERRGVVSDLNGLFSIQADKSKVISFSCLGYKTRELPAAELTGGNIVLQDDASVLDELVVIGYGTKRKRDLTGSIASISSKDMESTPVKDVLTAMQGRVAGVQIISSSGAPGSSMQIRVRGASSLNSGNSPLYVVDGIPIETTSSSLLNVDDEHGLNPLSYLSPGDIESIEVLKDAASSSIYGSRAANGVVLITTKRGKEGKATINLFSSFGISNITRKLSVLNSRQWREFILEGYRNYDLHMGLASETGVHYTVVDSLNPVNSGDGDWQSLMYNTAYEKQVGVNISGGTKAMRYSLSTSYLDQEGIIRNSKYKRFTTRANTEFDASEYIKVGTNVAYTYSTNDRISAGGMGNRSMVVALLTRPPTYALNYPDGSYLGYLNGKRNPIALAEECLHLNTSHRVNANEYLEISFTKWLKFKTSFSIDFEAQKEDEFFPTTVDYRVGYNTGAVRVAEYFTWANENYFTYNQSFSGHNVSGLLGFSQQEWKTDVTGLNGSTFVSDDIRTLNGAGTISGQEVNVAYGHSMASFFARGAYDYKGKYLFEVNLRADGSSRFGKNNRFGYFPSASAAWRFSDEKWFKSIKFVNDAKLRLSVGQTGNEAIDNYTAQGTFITGRNYLTNAGVAPYQMPNADLSWETTTQYNLGLDLSFLYGRVDFIFDAYIKNTKDLLYDVPMPNTTGFTSVINNVGEVQNKGLEFSVISKNLVDKFKWNTTFNISFNKNKVVSLPKEVLVNGYIQNGSFHILKEGEPISTFFGYKYKGIYAYDTDNVDQLRHLNSTGKIFKGGDVIWEDIDKNGYIDQNDRTIIGNAQPLFVGGLTNDFSYKNFSLNIFMQFSYGNDIYNNVDYYRNSIFSYNNVSTEFYYNAWRNQGDVTEYPKVVRNDPMQNEARVQSRWVEDGSYLKVKTATFAYEFPKNVVSKFKLQSLKLYVTGSNLLTFTNYSGYDPDVNTLSSGLRLGVDYGSYPQSRTFLFGLNIGF
ncbi:MAG: TonB-dependent receptor [Bacteroidetes bacterium HGW-Bacteroidetes-5]|jgi:TonB-linked SusC/RagA family outer membrane protein|nr:MAG: TonB-dependent receptor [Bacteroidetes bacterium HGW-Bacteroidetes-5]